MGQHLILAYVPSPSPGGGTGDLSTDPYTIGWAIALMLAIGTLGLLVNLASRRRPPQ